MNEDKNTKQQKEKEKRGYGVKIPGLSFPDAIKAIKDIANLGGFDGNSDVLSQVFGNSPSSSNFFSKVYALKGFGLLTYQAKQYSFSEISHGIAQADSTEIEKTAIVDAFLKHDILAGAWANYTGKILPQREYLANYFEKAFKIPSDLKLAWADYFIDAAKFAGLILEKENGSMQMLSEAAKLPEPKKELKQEQPEQNRTPSSPIDDISTTIASQHWGILNQRKISGNRKAIFAVPDELTQEDIEMLRVILKGVDASLDGLKKSNVQ